LKSPAIFSPWQAAPHRVVRVGAQTRHIGHECEGEKGDDDASGGDGQDALHLITPRPQ
jgi:hypothetical protein